MKRQTRGIGKPKSKKVAGIRAGEAYSLGAMQEMFGLGTCALPEARKKGLRSHRMGKRVVYLGNELLDYLRRQSDKQN